MAQSDQTWNLKVGSDERENSQPLQKDIVEGFCGNLLCGKKANQFRENGKVINGSLCPACFKNATREK
jgi:hypothetical protein